jgi:hypothetical protein
MMTKPKHDPPQLIPETPVSFATILHAATHPKLPMPPAVERWAARDEAHAYLLTTVRDGGAYWPGGRGDTIELIRELLEAVRAD